MSPASTSTADGWAETPFFFWLWPLGSRPNFASKASVIRLLRRRSKRSLIFRPSLSTRSETMWMCARGMSLWRKTMYGCLPYPSASMYSAAICESVSSDSFSSGCGLSEQWKTVFFVRHCAGIVRSMSASTCARLYAPFRSWKSPCTSSTEASCFSTFLKL